ncbi:MAG: Phage head-tail adapter protein [Oscillospiraceae bacterium]|jgi:SPP1 family predicted phage head-tail adaptor
MTYDYALALINYKTDYNEIGQEIKVPIKTNILCAVKSIVRSEFYAAAQAGLKPEITFVVHAYEYSGEKEVEFEGQKYKVIRTYLKRFEELELVCEKVIGNC